MNTEGLKTVLKLMIFQILTSFLPPAASIPTNISSTSVISNSATAINNASNSSLTDNPFCIVPAGRGTSISIKTCQPALNQLMEQPDPATSLDYHWFGTPLRLTEAPCIISLDCVGPNDEISLSAKEIAGHAYWVIAKCQLARAGWMHVDGSNGWLVSVMGAAEGNDIGNATMGETQNTSLLGDQGERYMEKTESS